jgi:antitoxin component of MazEF toxin-antitoxin module
MEARIQIQKWNNSLGINIPQLIASEMSLREGLFMNIHEKDNKIIIEPVKSEFLYNLTDMLSNITENNIHQSIDTGIPIGKEVW